MLPPNREGHAIPASVITALGRTLRIPTSSRKTTTMEMRRKKRRRMAMTTEKTQLLRSPIN
jgi:hypothetical protein